MTRPVIHLPLNTTNEFNRGIIGTPRSAPDPVSLLPGDQQITVNWNKDLLGQGYRVFYSTSTITDYTTATRITITDNDTDSYVITGLDNGITYYVRVVTVNGAGYSDLTTEVSAVPSLFSNTLSCHFDGVTERANNTATSDFDFGKTTPFSISLWAKFDGTRAGTDDTFCGNMNTGFNYEGFEFHKTATSARVYFAKIFGSDYIGVSWAGLYIADTWRHIVLTYSGSNLATGFNCYFDGLVVTRVVAAAGPISGVLNSWGNFTVGARENALKPAKGNFDELAIYNKELTADEVQEIYNSGTPCKLDGLTTGPNLISWWRLGDNDTNTTMYDTIGSNDLTNINIDSSNYQADVP